MSDNTMAVECIKQAEELKEFHGEDDLVHWYSRDEALEAADGLILSTENGTVIEMPDGRRLYVSIQSHHFERIEIYELQPDQTEPDDKAWPALTIDTEPMGLDQNDHF